MAQNSVCEKILEKAQQERSELLRLGAIKANEITENKIKEANELAKHLIDNANSKNNEMIKGVNATLIQNQKQQILENRKHLIKDTFNKANLYLQKITDEELVSLVTNLLKKTNLKESCEIKVCSLDYNRYQKLFSTKKDNNLDKLSKMVDLDDVKFSLSKDVVNITGGFVIISDYFDIDYSYSSLLENLSKELETEINDILFKEA